MKYLVIVVSCCIFAGILGCESDTEITFTPLRGSGIDSAHLHLPDTVTRITLQPVAVPIRIDSSSGLKDSMILYSYAHGSVADTNIFQIRKPTVVLEDTLHIYYYNVTPDLDTVASQHEEYFKLDSVKVLIPKGKTCTVEGLYP